MTLRSLLTTATEQLQISQFAADTPHLDALVLLEWASGLRREKLLAHLSDRVTTLAPDLVERFQDAIDRRSRGEPVAYIRGFREFYGFDFDVNPNVLIPRPETETLVEAALELIRGSRNKPFAYHDCCTGSGCVAISIAATLAHDSQFKTNRIQVSMSDMSSAALKLAQHNAIKIVPELSIPAWPADVLVPQENGDPELPQFDLITANPPYLTSAETTSVLSQGWNEPQMALDGGSDGLDVIGRLVMQAFDRLKPHGCLMVEIADNEYQEVERLLKAAGFERVHSRTDLAGQRRLATGFRDVAHENDRRS